MLSFTLNVNATCLEMIHVRSLRLALCLALILGVVNFTFCQSFSSQNNGILFGTNIIIHNNGMLCGEVPFTSFGYRIHNVDTTNGNIIWTKNYGTPSSDRLFHISKLESNTALEGYTYGHVTVDNRYVFVPLLVIIDSAGNSIFQQEILFDSLFNNYNGEVASSCQINGSSYHVGVVHEATQFANFDRLYVCKRNAALQLLYMSPREQTNAWYLGSCASYDNTILIGHWRTEFDSTLQNFKNYALISEVDTLGHLLREIRLLNTDSIAVGDNMVREIYRNSNYQYVVKLAREVQVLDSNFNLVVRGIPTDGHLQGKSAFVNTTKQGFGFVGYLSVSFFDSAGYLENQLDFARPGSDPKELVDATQLSDGSIIGWLRRTSGATFFRTNCLGKYLDSISCWPTSTLSETPHAKNITVLSQCKGWLLVRQSPSAKTHVVELRTIAGNIIASHIWPKNTVSFDLAPTNIASQCFVLLIYDAAGKSLVHKQILMN
jgi:hypothetical protein